MFPSSIRTAREYERFVITKHGRFKRIVGPGRCWLRRKERVERSINVRNKLTELDAGRMFMNRMSVGVTLRYYCRFDPKEVAGNDRALLRSFVFCPDQERRDKIQTQLKLAINNCVNQVTKGRVITDESSLFERISPVLAGVPDYATFIELLQPELDRILRSVGMILDRSEPIVVHKLDLSPTDVQGLIWAKDVAKLRQLFGQLDDDRMAQLLTSLASDQPLRGINATIKINGNTENLDSGIVEFLNSIE